MNYTIWFSCLSEIIPIKKLNLINFFKSFENVYKASEIELMQVKQIDLKDVQEIAVSKSNNNIKRIENIERYINKYKINVLSIHDADYPNELKEIYDSPCVLFYMGDLKLINTCCVGVVGSRLASDYGMQSSYNIGKEISSEGITVVSGLARGIDAMAHKGALDSMGKTIAVIGNGLDYIYPSENIDLYKKIAEKGLIISEYPPGSKPLASNFPARNRIISALSKAIIVVEAKKDSGALITVDYAIEQGKLVYAVPGNINSINSVGCNELIKDGAMIYTCKDDLCSS